MNPISSLKKTILSSLHEILAIFIIIFFLVIFLPSLAPLFSLVILTIFSIFLVLKYRILKPIFETETPDLRRELVGKQALVVQPLTPNGQVLLNGETWTAKTSPNTTIGKGEWVRIIDIEGLTLIVDHD